MELDGMSQIFSVFTNKQGTRTKYNPYNEDSTNKQPEFFPYFLPAIPTN